MNGARKPRRVRWHPSADTMTLALHNAAKPAPADIDQVLDVLHRAHKALREGVATEQQWSVLAGCLDVAVAIERQGVVRGLSEHLASADAALQAVYNRAQTGAAWRPTALYFQELDAVRTFVHLHAMQIRQLARSEYLRAITSAQGAVRGRGETVTVARDLAGVGV